MPGILPMKVIKLGAPCDNCKTKDRQCDRAEPTCSCCAVEGIDCKYSTKSRIAQACDRCRSKRIRCDGIQPCCTQCKNVDIECKTSDKVLRRAFPRGYTESLEESETRELKDLLDDKDERIDVLNRLVDKPASRSLENRIQTTQHKNRAEIRDEINTLTPGTSTSLCLKTFELSRCLDSELVLPQEREIQPEHVASWAHNQTHAMLGKTIDSKLSILLVKTPSRPVLETQEILPRRESYDEVESTTSPILNALRMPSQILETFGSVVADEYPADLAQLRLSALGSDSSSGYHVGYGFLSLAWRNIPGGNTLAVLLYQDSQSQEITERLLKDVYTHQEIMGHPLLLPLLANKAIGFEVKSWLKTHESEIITAQSQTGQYHLLALKKPNGHVDFSQLSAKLSGIATNIASIQFCLQTLSKHAALVCTRVELEAKLQASGKTLTKKQIAATTYIEAHAASVARNAKFMLLEAELCQKKASIQLQGIFNLIAQQDQNTSIGIARDSKTIAEESKKDTTSMKAIAIVTMTFLPGTFMAALLSMPIFNWDAGAGADVINPRIWAYWAFTVPLTLLTFVAWVLWIRYKHDSEPPRNRESVATDTPFAKSNVSWSS